MDPMDLSEDQPSQRSARVVVPASLPSSSPHVLTHDRDQDAMDTLQSEEKAVFSCKADSTEILLAMLQTIHVGKDQVAVCTVTASGMKFTVEKAKALQAKAYLKKVLFQDFELRDEHVEFSINLSVLLQCLQVFGASAHLEMTYDGEGSSLSLLLEDDGVITQCEIRTLDVPGSMDFNFRAYPISSRAIIKSQFLREAFSELEAAGATFLNINWFPEAPFLSFSVLGDVSSCQVEFPLNASQDNEIFLRFESKESVQHRYNLSLFKACVKALLRAEQTNLRVNSQGLLSMQHVIPADDQNNWVEFLLCSEQVE